MKAALACVLVLAAALPAAAADVSGKWVGDYKMTYPDGSTEAAPLYMVFKQGESELTGTAGPAEQQQWPITKGKVTADKITFEVQSDGPLFKVELTLVDGRLKGQAVGDVDGGTVKATLDLEKKAEK